MRAVLKLVILLPIAIAAILVAVANRAPVRVVLDPFARENAFAIEAPLFLVIFMALAAGLLIGGFATWIAQYPHRRRERRFRRDAERQRREADHLRISLDEARAAPPAAALPPSALPPSAS